MDKATNMKISNSHQEIINVMTVDVEDYFQVSAFSRDIRREKWQGYESRVERNTKKLLDIFAENGITGTFFVLGWIAERYPELIGYISDMGHEIASHGYSHDLIYNQSIETFYEETKRSKVILEDIIGKPIYGYRAASYSITKKSLWALDVLSELGFKYDSSIFPILHDRYGIPNAKNTPHVYETNKGNKIIEMPLSTIGIKQHRLPIGGGGYFRLFPYWLTNIGLKMLNNNKQSFIFYMHPWEIDTEQPRIKSSYLSEFRHYNNIDKFESRLLKLICNYKFSTIYTILKENKLWDGI